MEYTTPKTLLLVEDEVLIAMDEAYRLSQNGFRVLTAHSGEEAVETALNDLSIDLILMDIDLGRGMDGTEAAREILRRRDVPIVFLTSHTSRETVEKVRNITRYGYVIKNSGEFVLLSSIDMAFELFDAHRRLEASEARAKQKLDAVLSPGGDTEDLELSDIIDVQAIQDLMDHFFALTNIGVSIADMNGKVLVATGWQDICLEFHRAHPETCRHCLESDIVLSGGVKPGAFKIYRCRNNMWDMATPLMAGGRQVGNLFLGQFLFEGESPDEETFREQARQYGFDVDDYLAALNRVPRWSRETVNSVMSFYTRLANLISLLSHNNVQLARTQAEHERLIRTLRKKEETHRLVLEASTDGMWDWDIPSGRFSCSAAWARIIGETDLCLEYDSWKSRLHPADREAVLESLTAHLEGKDERWEREYRIRTASGKWKWVLGRGHVVHRDEAGAPLRMVGTMSDIGRRKGAEEELLKYQQIISCTPDGVSLLDRDYRYGIVNRAYETFSGRNPQELIGQTVAEYLGEEIFHKYVKENFDKCLAGESVQYQAWVRYPTLGERLVDVRYFPYVDTDGEIAGVVASTRDITDVKLAHESLWESEARYRQLVESSPEAIILAQQWKIVYINSAGAILLGANAPEELMHKPLLGFAHPESSDLVRKCLEDLHQGRRIAPVEQKIVRRDGGERMVEVSGVPVNYRGKPAMQVLMRDITERKRSERKLKAALEEKEILLKEVYHRTKNNMASICGLLRLQAGRVEDAGVVGSLKEIEQRVHSMALVQKKLYQSKNLVNIPLDSYIEELAWTLLGNMRTDETAVDLKLDLHPVTVPPDTAIPCGLLLTELMTNALKYAFPQARTGKIGISLHKVGAGNIELHVSDNGVGLPEDLDMERTDSLGLRLVLSFVEQLRGFLEIGTTGGTVFVIRFPVPMGQNTAD